MKKYFLFGIPLLLIIVGIWLYQWWKHPKPPEGFVLPTGCEFVSAVNTHLLIEQLFKIQSNKLKNLDEKRLKKLLERSQINVLKPIFVYGSLNREFKGICLSFSKPDSLRMVLSEIGFVTSRTNKDSMSFKDFSAVLNTQAHLIYVNYKVDIKEISKSPIYSKYMQLNQTFDHELCKGFIDASLLSPYLGADNVVDSICDFKLELEAQKLSIVFAGINKLGLFIDTSIDASINLPWSLITNLKKYPEIIKTSKKLGIDTTGWKNAQGNFNFLLNGTSVTKQKYITYAMDDEFNRIEVVNYKSKLVPNFAISFPVVSDLWYQRTNSDSSKSDYKIKNLFGLEMHLIHTSNMAQITGIQSPKSQQKIKGLFSFYPRKIKKVFMDLGLPTNSLEPMLTVNSAIVSYNKNQLTLEVLFEKDWSSSLIKILQ